MISHYRNYFIFKCINPTIMKLYQWTVEDTESQILRVDDGEKALKNSSLGKNNWAWTWKRGDLNYFPFLSLFSRICCAILSTSLRCNGQHLRWWMVSQHSDGLLDQIFWGFPQLNARRSVHSPQFHLIIITPLIW